MTDIKPKKKRGRKPQPRVRLDIPLPHEGTDSEEWAEPIIAGLASMQVISNCAKIQIWVGSRVELYSATGAVIELLRASGVLHRRARVTDIIGRVDKTIPPLTARVEIAGTLDPDHRKSLEGRRSAIVKNLMRHDAVRQLTRSGAHHALA